MARTSLTRLGVLVVLTLVLVGCQQQPTGVRTVTVAVASTPTVVPSPTPGERVFDVERSYPCGPFGWIDYNLGMNRLVLAWTPDGAHLVFNYLPADYYGSVEIPYHTAFWRVDAAGSRLKMIVDANPGQGSMFGNHADISPDGVQLVYASCEFSYRKQVPEREDFDYEVVVVTLDGSGQQRLTENRSLDHYPVWSPDGNRIAFLEPHYEYLRLNVMAGDGSEKQRVTQPHPYGLTLAPPVWSPDGERLAFQVNTADPYYLQRDLYAVKVDGTEMALLTKEVVSLPAWSPDGTRLAVAKYAGDYVALITLAVDGTDHQLVTNIFKREVMKTESPFSETIPTVKWSPDGTRLVYSCEFGVCLVDLASGEVTALVEDNPFIWFFPYAAAWSADGARVAIYTPGDRHPQLFTVAPDGSDRRHLIRVDDDGNLVPANPPQETP